MAAIIGDIKVEAPEEHSLDKAATKPGLAHRLHLAEQSFSRRFSQEFLSIPGHLADVADGTTETLFGLSLFEGDASEGTVKALEKAEEKYNKFFDYTPVQVLDEKDKNIKASSEFTGAATSYLIPGLGVMKASQAARFAAGGLGKGSLWVAKTFPMLTTGGLVYADYAKNDGKITKAAVKKTNELVQENIENPIIKGVVEDTANIIAPLKEENMTTEEKNKQTMQPSFENSAKDSSNFLVQTFEKVTGIDMPKSLGGTMESALSGTGSFMDEHPWYSRLFLGVMTYLGVDQLTGDDDNGLSMIIGTIGAFVLPSLLKTAPEGPEQQVAAAPAPAPGGNAPR